MGVTGKQKTKKKKSITKIKNCVHVHGKIKVDLIKKNHKINKLLFIILLRYMLLFEKFICVILLVVEIINKDGEHDTRET